MWIRRSELLTPLSRLCSKTVKFVWTSVEQTAFDKLKKVICTNVMLAYPDFNIPFVIHTDASDVQLGSVISQEEKPIAFYSRKLNSAQKNYTTSERELLSIVETLKEFRNILLGFRIIIYTDHQNLIYPNQATARIIRWRLLIEEFGPELKYIPGAKNIVADTLSRLNILPSDKELNEYVDCFVSHDDDFPLTYEKINSAQQKDKKLLKQTSKYTVNYGVSSYHGGEGTIRLITYKNKIAISITLQKQVMEWYHNTLCHPGSTRT